jgi:hypothetical protein
MIIEFFRKQGQSHLAVDMSLSWVNLVTDPDAVSRKEMLDTNNEWAEEMSLPFRFTNYKYDPTGEGEVLWTLSGGIPKISESEEDDDMFAPDRSKLGMYIRSKRWSGAADECMKIGRRDRIIEKNIIPGIVRSEGTSTIAGGGTSYLVGDWYRRFIAPAPWPDLVQYVSGLKNKAHLASALSAMASWYTNTPENREVTRQLIVAKKNAAAAVAFTKRITNSQRWPEMEPYIMVDPQSAMYYAASVIGQRWPEAEPFIATNTVSWSMYSARLLDTNNGTKAGRATRDAARQEALRRLPDGHKRRIAEEDDMFAPSSISLPKKAAELKHKGTPVYIQVPGPGFEHPDLVDGIFYGDGIWERNKGVVRYHIGDSRTIQAEINVNGDDWVLVPYKDGVVLKPKLVGNLAEDDDMFANSNRASTVPAILLYSDSEFFLDPKIKQLIVDYCHKHLISILGSHLDAWMLEIYFKATYEEMLPLIQQLEELARKQDCIVQALNGQWSIPQQKPVYNESVDDTDMFAPSKFQKWAEAIKVILDHEYDYLSQEYNSQEPSNSKYLELIGEKMSDYDFLRSELERGGVRAFINGLDSVGQDIINSIDSVLAIKFKMQLVDMEKIVNPGLFNESKEDDMFSDNRLNINPRDLQMVTRTLAARYRTYANTSDDEQMTELYLDDSEVFERASNAFESGMRAGIAELGGLVDPSSWDDLTELAADYNIDLNELMNRYDAGSLSESDDDMFSAGPNLTQKLGDALTRYGDGVLMYADDLKGSDDPDTRDYVSELKAKGGAYVSAGAAFEYRGMQAGIMEWVLIDRDAREEFINYTKEVENWNPEEVINGHLGLAEDAAGVGVVKNSKDPRYVMATMGDQNDVTADTLPNMMRGYNLIGKKAKKK